MSAMRMGATKSSLVRNCSKCKGKMVDSGMMHSGNAKYRLQKCEDCGNEVMECVGLE
jgi:hypothetical protein